MINRKQAVNIYRVSSQKQFTQGDSLEDQKKLCILRNKELGHQLVTEFSLVETGTDKDREDFQKAIDFCKDHKNKIVIVNPPICEDNCLGNVIGCR